MIFYFLGTFSTKLLQFLFIPLYTIYIETSDFGYFNLVMSLVALSVPLLYQSVWEGVLRFAIEKQNDKMTILSTTSSYCLVLTTIYSIVFLLITKTFRMQYGTLILMMALGQMGVSYWQFSARALNENKLYSISTVANAAVTITLNFVLIVVLKWGLMALFLSNTVGSLVMIAILEFRLHLLRNAVTGGLNLSLLRDILKYSFPLSINALSWWLITSCNSLVISQRIGIDQNGIYSIASRFGAIMTLVTSVVNMAWLEESFRIYGNKESDEYFNNVFDLLTRVTLSGVSLLIPVTYVFYSLFVFGGYSRGVGLTPIVYLNAAFATFASYLGSGFLARKESNVIFQTTLLAGIISTGGGYVVAPIFGLMGVVVTSLIGSIFMYAIRIPLLHRRMLLEINHNRVIGLTILCVTVMFASNFNAYSVPHQITVFLITALITYIANRQIIATLVQRIGKKMESHKRSAHRM